MELLLKTKKKKKTLTELLNRKQRQEKLIELFKKHIGMDNEINQRTIFVHIFGDPNKYTYLQIYWLWDQLKKDMNWLRRTSNCFIVSRSTDYGWRYYLPKNTEDIKPYIKRLSSIKKKCDYMMKRASKAVSKKFYKDL